MEIVYSIFIGMISSKIVGMVVGIGLLAPRGAWLRQKSCQEISCTVVALLILKKCVSSDAL